MKFPIIGDIASRAVVSINIHHSIADAIELMLENEHRNVIVEDINRYYILTVLDILRFQNLDIDLHTKLNTLRLCEVPVIYKEQNILDTLEFLNSDLEYICVVNEDKTLFGIVTHTNITSNIDPDILIDHFRLSDFLKLNRRMKWVGKDEKTADLLNDMIANSFDNTVIVEDLKPIGILTTKDIVTLIKNNSDLELSVSHYMSSPVQSINKNASIKEALNFLKTKHYKRVIVVDDSGKLSGVIAQKEFVSLTYSRWALLMKEYQSELSEINTILESKNREYEIKASTDSLTGLYNRYKFSELYISAYQTMVQRHNEMSVILLDIDFFKKVNDTYGHNTGDIVLITISNLLQEHVRNIDVCCRWGGEEFVTLLPTASLQTAASIAEKLRLQIEALKIKEVDRVTASFGVSQVREGESMEAVIGRADKALYLAKHYGRNCVKTELD